MKNRKIDQKTIKQVVIDAGVHKLLKAKSSSEGRSIKEVVEECLMDYLAVVPKK